MSKKSKPKKTHYEQLEELAELRHKERVYSWENHPFEGDNFNENYFEILRLHDEREKLVEAAEKAGNQAERNSYDQALIKVQKEIQELYGVRPCGSRTCLRYLPPDRPKLKYCPDDNCRNREKWAREYDRKKGPKGPKND